MGSVGFFNWVLWGFTELYWSITWVFASLTVFSRVLLGFT